MHRFSLSGARSATPAKSFPYADPSPPDTVFHDAHTEAPVEGVMSLAWVEQPVTLEGARARREELVHRVEDPVEPNRVQRRVGEDGRKV